MRFYPVPFSAKGEEKLVYNMAIREVLIISIGIGLGLGAAGILSLMLHTLILFCIPVALPFIGLAAIIAFTRINKNDNELTLDAYFFRLIKYKQRPRHYLKIRKEAKQD